MTWPQGDFLEAWMGVALGIGTMTAAALGNAVSDVAGIGRCPACPADSQKALLSCRATSWRLR